MMQNLRIIAIALLTGVAIFAPGAIAAPGVAFVTDLKGDATADGARLTLMTEVADGQKVIVSPNGSASVMFVQSGDEYALAGGGQYSIRKNEVTPETGGGVVKRSTAWRPDLGRVADISKSATASLRMRGLPAQPPASAPDGSFQAIYPSAGKIATVQPVLRWSPIAGQKSYTISVSLGDKQVHTAKANGDSFKLPIKLAADSQYTWTVSAGEQQAKAQFATPSADELKRLAAAKPGTRATFSDHLLYAITLQTLGAMQDAKAYWQTLAVQRPEVPELAALAK